MKKLLVKWFYSLIAETPIMWANIRNICAFIVIAIPVIEGSVVAASAPIWFNAIKWYIMSISLIIGLIAQSQTKKTS